MYIYNFENVLQCLDDVLHKKQYDYRTTELAVNQIVDKLTEAGSKKIG